MGKKPYDELIKIQNNHKSWLTKPINQADLCLFPAMTVIQIVMADKIQGK